MSEAEPNTVRRQQILDVASELLERDGVHALSTRSVATAAGVRAASLYQLFGDKDGLLTALAVLAFDRYLAQKQTVPTTGDPVEDIRGGWDAHVEFGLRHPALYLLMFGTDRPDRRPPVADEAQRLLLRFLDRVARAGQLRVTPAIAARVLQAGVTGVTLSLIAEPDAERDMDVSIRVREAVIDSVVVREPVAPSNVDRASRALALDAVLAAEDDGSLPLRPAETALLRDWLHRLA